MAVLRIVLANFTSIFASDDAEVACAGSRYLQASFVIVGKCTSFVVH